MFYKYIKRFAFLTMGLSLGYSALAQDNLNNKPKAASSFTGEVNQGIYSQLNFADTSDFVNAKRGFMASLDEGIIFNAAHETTVNLNEYGFLKGKAPASVNPALWRHAEVNAINGLFKVTEGIYQIRSFDLSVMSFIETNTGYVVVDPLTNIEAAHAGYALVKKYVADKPVVAVITTHSHADHYGGVEGIVNAADILSGKVKYIVPTGFYQEVVSENVLLGNAMIRRAGYQFGWGLERNENGQVDAGLGKSYTSKQTTSSLLEPNIQITKTGETITVDGLDIVFQMAPGSEAPAEFYFYLPKYRAFCPAENANQTLHNILTPRGAKVRDTKAWAGYLDEAIDLFGSKTDVVFLTHGWPIFGHDKSIEFLEKQRDLYKYIHDQTVFLANKGLGMEEIAETIKLPGELSHEWYNRDFYGTVKHNSKAVYQFYLGWWDGNPANYNKLPETEAAKRYVEYMGGEKAIVEKAKVSYAKGDYRWVAEVLKHVVFANPENIDARNLQADAFEQLAYQSESGIWRNLYLKGAQELRLKGNISDIPNVPNNLRSEKFLKNLTIESLFDYLSISIDGQKSAGKDIAIRFIFPDIHKNVLVYLKNGVLHQSQTKSEQKSQLTLTIDKSKFTEGLANPQKFREILFSSDVKREGDIFAFKALFELLERPNPNWNIVTP